MTDSSQAKDLSQKKVPVGRIGRSKGLKGFVRIVLFNPESRILENGQDLYVSFSDACRNLRLKKQKIEKDEPWVIFEGYENPELAKTLTGLEVSVLRADLPSLPKGQYYHVDLLSCQVFDLQGQLLGVLQQILPTASNDIWSIRTPMGQELLLPDIEGVVMSVDLANKKITVDPPEYADEV
ncbi:MAG: 16S rRNA processing protein RimM [Bdellovibrionales bacterium]|nr:16S rRNA processing protein RimM [Bdellovibrionales bacterium]